MQMIEQLANILDKTNLVKITVRQQKKALFVIPINKVYQP